MKTDEPGSAQEDNQDDKKKQTCIAEPSRGLTENRCGSGGGETVPASLLALLDDKNKSIMTLKRQIHHQKLQLGFYLHKVLNSPKVSNLADSCVPSELEENLSVNLAMSRFCRQTGLKSRIMELHQRMTNVEDSITSILHRQDEMVHAIVTKIAEFARDAGVKSKTQLYLSRIREDKVDMLAKILGSNNKLRKELDIFRTCCDRLVVIEDERNSLVEHVYSLPVRKRLNYGVLLAAQYDKLRLEREVNEIKHEQNILQKRLTNLSGEGLAEKTIVEGEESSKSKEIVAYTQITKTQQVSEKPDSILDAEDKLREYQEEIDRLKTSNEDLGRQVGFLQETQQAKEHLEERLAKAKLEYQEMQERRNSEFAEINDQLKAVTEERDFLRIRLENYCELESEVAYLKEKVVDMDSVVRERDYCKSQVEDLQAIRAAYIQLVETYPSPEDITKKQEIKKLTSKVTELEGENARAIEEATKLKDVIKDQEAQIKQLVIIIKEVAKQWDDGTRKRKKSAHKARDEHKKSKTGPRKESLWNISEEDSSAKDGKRRSRRGTTRFSQTGEETVPAQERGRRQCAPYVVALASVGEQTRSDLSTCTSYASATNTIFMTPRWEIEQARQSHVMMSSVECQTDSCGHVAKSKHKNQLQTPSSHHVLVTRSTSVDLVLETVPDVELLRHSSNDTVVITLPRRTSPSGHVTVQRYWRQQDKTSYSMERLRKLEPSHSPSLTRAVSAPVTSSISGEETEKSECAGDVTVETEELDVVTNVGTGGGGNVSVLDRLKRLTTDLGQTLSLPGGRITLLNSVKSMYGTLFSEMEGGGRGGS